MSGRRVRRALVALVAPALADDAVHLIGGIDAAAVRDDVRGFLTAWWPEITLGLVVLAMVLAALARRRLTRRLTRFFLLRWLLRPRLRMAIKVEQASGAEPPLADGFAAQIRTRVRELSARYASDPRVVYGSDAPVDVPVRVLPAQAKALVELWHWFSRANTVTLQVTLLPAAAHGVSCHVVLLEKNGTPTRGVRVPEHVLTYRPSSWAFEPAPGASWCSLQWLPLANLATAWALFAFRSLQVPPVVLAEEFGTASGAAYIEMLAGLEHGDTPAAMRHYRRAVEIDPDFVEAHLNLASALGNVTWDDDQLQAENLREAERILLDVLERIPRGTGSPRALRKAALRWRSLELRSSYSLAMVRFNQLASTLGHGSASSAELDRANRLVWLLDELESRTIPCGAPREWRRPPSAEPRVAAPQDVVTPQPRPEPRGLLGVWERSWLRYWGRRVRVLLTDQQLERETDQLIVLRRQLEPHVRLLLAGAVDLQTKLRGLSTGNRSLLPLPADGDPAATSCTCVTTSRVRHDSACRRRAVATLAQIPMTGTPPRIHYTLACTWARDFRMRPHEECGTDKAAVLRRCLARLSAACEDPCFAERWPADPDLRDLHTAMTEWTEEREHDTSSDERELADEVRASTARVPAQDRSEVTPAR